MYSFFSPQRTECKNNMYVHSKKLCLNLNVMQPMIQNNNNREQNPCVLSTRISFINSFLCVHSTKYSFFFRKKNKPMKYSVVRKKSLHHFRSYLYFYVFFSKSNSSQVISENDVCILSNYLIGKFLKIHKQKMVKVVKTLGREAL